MLTLFLFLVMIHMYQIHMTNMWKQTIHWKLYNSLMWVFWKGEQTNKRPFLELNNVMHKFVIWKSWEVVAR
jgi:hypothetical protein